VRNQPTRTSLPWAILALAAAMLLPAGCGRDAGDAPPPLPLNHVLLVVEPETYAAVRESSFLREEFAFVEERMTLADGGESWQGIYLYGAHTYLELFESDPNDRSEGSGLALGVEEPGGLARVASALAPLRDEPPEAIERSRVRDSDAVPWFSWVGLGTDDPGTSFWPWVMEYHPDYLRLWHGDESSDGNGITLAEHRAREYVPSRLLIDIVRVTVALEDEEAEPLVRDLLALGWSERSKPDARVLAGPALELRVEPYEEGRHGLVELGLTVRSGRSAGAAERRLGASTLTFRGDGTATWSFR